MKGYFRVYEDPDHAGDIYFEQIELEPDEKVPEEQIELITAIGQTIAVLRSILKGVEYERRFNAVLSLSQVGVSGDSAQPQLARRMLDLLQMEVIDSEGGRIKNRYMQRLGIQAMLLAGLGGAAATFGFWRGLDSVGWHGVIWAGCMVGVWLSFGIRRVTMSFETLHVIESDFLSPGIRLVFAGLLTMVLALMLQVGLFSFQLGAFDSVAFPSDFQSTLLFGLASGISEKALSEQVAVSARQFLQQGA